MRKGCTPLQAGSRDEGEGRIGIKGNLLVMGVKGSKSKSRPKAYFLIQYSSIQSSAGGE